MKHVFYVENYEKVIDKNYFKDLYENIYYRKSYTKSFTGDIGTFSWYERWSEKDGLNLIEAFRENPRAFIFSKSEERYKQDVIISKVESTELRLVKEGDEIELLSSKGKVESIHYSPNTHTVHYKTDIKTYEKQEISEQEIEEIIKSYHEQADELEKFCKERIAEIELSIQADKEAYEEKTKKRPFWKRLFD